jgi:sugar transferase (PEP-CTERM/EpsH1 system associated)
MRDLLFLSHRVPYPPDKGEKIRAWHILLHLARNHRIHLGCLIDDPADWEHLNVLCGHCADLACFPLRRNLSRLKSVVHLRPGMPLSPGYFHHRRLRDWTAAKLNDPAIDRVFVYSSAMAPYAMPDSGSHRPAIRVLDMVDVDSQKWAAYARQTAFPMRAVWAREARTLLAFERRAALDFDHSLFVSEQEWQCFVTLAPETVGRTGWIDNGVDLDHFAPDQEFRPPFSPSGADIVFTGRMDYRPNVEAVDWFAREAMPALHNFRPAARFWIVGAAPASDVMQLASLPGVTVVGRVADTRPYLQFADVVVAHLRIARGIQNKVLEGMAMARPVVATPQAFDGVRAMPGRDILLADGVDDTVQRIIEVLDGQHPALGAAGRQAMETAHCWSVTLRPLDQIFSDASEPVPPRSTPIRMVQPA